MGYFIEYDAHASLYSVQAAFQLNAEVFDRAGASDKLEGFASFHGPDHYQLPRNIDRITLTRRAWSVPDAFPFDGDTVTRSARVERSHGAQRLRRPEPD